MPNSLRVIEKQHRCQHQRTKKQDKTDEKAEKNTGMPTGCATGTIVHLVDTTRIQPELI